MAGSFNSVCLVGNVTRDPELRTVAGGKAVANLGLAINSKRKGPDGEWLEDVVFVDVSFWGREAEVAAEFVSRGSSILVAGRLRFETWEKDGQKRSKHSVVGDRLVLLGSRPTGGGDAAEPAEVPEVPRFSSERPARPEIQRSELDHCPF
ncbi:Ssb Single-stranded DNA-binding protein [uncultured Caudovirales phage]|uniref:Single-stranded DNA-binding protein n=1 Tax=uncultured Caudovirales phage TaxID=2100421 RepID=A0A6J5QZE8_9CAUD|nr:Ssb Single-stranded DNA-binding protein [uncultured Caudovirales phage]